MGIGQSVLRHHRRVFSCCWSRGERAAVVLGIAGYSHDKPDSRGPAVVLNIRCRAMQRRRVEFRVVIGTRQGDGGVVAN